jgi:hypothetical protein
MHTTEADATFPDGRGIDQVRELLVANSVEEVARKIGRSRSSVKHLCGRVGIRSRELRCDLFSVTGYSQENEPC